MTKTTEELKREMYQDLARVGSMVSTTHLYKIFEESLEAYLEAMRQEAVAKDVRIDHLERMGDVMRDGYMYQQQLTAQARTEADRERNRCQAFEFANKSAGEFLKESQRLLKEARESVKRQRQSIGQLKRDRNDAQHTLKVRDRQLLEARRELSELRNSQPGTSAQSSQENIACAKPGALLPHERRLDADECAHKFGIGQFCMYCCKPREVM